VTTTKKINELHLKYYNEALDRAMELKASKMNDYNAGKVNRFDYYLHGEQTGVDEIFKKVLRLVSLHQSGNVPENESIDDTLFDLINYSADLYSYRRWTYGKKD